MQIRNATKRVLWPGLDLHTRDRRRALKPHVRAGGRVLDAGCGNGYLALEAARRGASVTAVSNDEDQLERNRDYFRFIGFPQVRFEMCSLYDIEEIPGPFDQIFCIEVLEHLTRDSEAVAAFRRISAPRAELIVCCPNSDHPEHALGRTNEPENGWHVRDGYNIESYQQLLEPNGYKIRETFGIGTSTTTRADRILRSIRQRVGEALAIPAFVAMAPLARIDRRSPTVPYSIAAICETV